MFFILATITAFSVGFLVTPILIQVLRKAKIGDVPGGRKIHKSFVPSMGGIGFFIAAAMTLLIWAWQFPLPDIKYILGGILFMFFVGLRDDIVELKASRKLLGQLMAVLLVVVLADIRIKTFHGFLGIEELPIAASYIFTTVVLLALTNGFNLIDGLDGLAGTIAIITLACLGGWFLVQGIESYALISFVFMGGILSFLAFNWHPAKIFMGDTGSLTIGFTLATLIVAFMEINEGLPSNTFLKFDSTFSISVALMIFPLYDMARVFTRRLLQGKGPMTPDKSHVHHFMMRMGLQHNQVALILGSLQFLMIVLAFTLRDYSDHIVLPILSVLVIFLGWRLDQVTVVYLKKKVELEPKVLELREMKAKKIKKVKIKTESLSESPVNLN
ncbi:undecaprenyl/decaprenyl-phosphate alpha-N-acetylglucosaminyl 1-phosphate transferase [Algoriphagus lutimaris]|uniref:glycosyltransferase family 4 protein n=1 Tax=Algoriphagus lutimaris TaxID=613197 RepID=UPI00196A2077|nr:MraY family glycosyltransferase [Algoriphagus lutimaris]MBN3518841.1 undecaprenyl/decaprenyl-phosphate alpha-N-acetylglucosaminyl 1-phosphate transferase [Algoriphagus lutimaris]